MGDHRGDEYCHYAGDIHLHVGKWFDQRKPNGNDDLYADRDQRLRLDHLHGKSHGNGVPVVRWRSLTTSCPGGTQGAAYAGCTIVANGGTPPYTFSVSTSPNFPPLPEGMSLNATTGIISSSLIGGQGTYTPEFVVTDSTNTQATQNISIAINGNNAFLATIFPSTSIFHHRVDAATTSLPVDTSPAAPMYSGYLSETVKPFFGNNSNAPFPNGIPAIEVPYNQADVSVATTLYQSYFTSGPIPANAPVEGTATRPEIDTFWSTWRQAGETTLPFTRCGRESTKTVLGPIPRTRFGPTYLRMP